MMQLVRARRATRCGLKRQRPAAWAAMILLTPVSLAAIPIAPASAQVSVGMRAQDIGINAAIGLATATVWGVLRGHGIASGITGGIERGIIGGAAMGVGRQVAASPFDGSGLAGREISAVGISLITSAGAEHMTLSLPVGPVQLQLIDGRTFDWRVNATDAVAAVLRATHTGTRVDAGLSLSSGTFVFRDRRQSFHTSSGEADAAEFFESITLARSAFNGTDRPNVLFHENVHVLQNDYLADAVTNPIERALLNRTSFGRRLTRHVDIGILSLPVNILANSAIKYTARPWEREAYALTPLHNY